MCVNESPIYTKYLNPHHIFTWMDGHPASDYASCPRPHGLVPKRYPVMNEGRDDNLIHIQPHMLTGTLALAFITLSGGRDES